MPYGIEISGSDASGTFVVNDSSKNHVGLVVVASGSGNTVSYSGLSSFYVFVNAKGVTDASGYTSNTGVNGYSESHPKGIHASIANGYIRFYSSTVQFSSSNLAYKTTWTLRNVDYFIAVPASNVSGSYILNHAYGVQIMTSDGRVAVDSRRFSSNERCEVFSGLQLGSSDGSILTNDEDLYVEMRYGTQGGTTSYTSMGVMSRRGIQFNASNIRYFSYQAYINVYEFSGASRGGGGLASQNTLLLGDLV
jgi:hypothetical protein